MKTKKRKNIQDKIRIFLIFLVTAAILTGCGRREQVFLDEITEEENQGPDAEQDRGGDQESDAEGDRGGDQESDAEQERDAGQESGSEKESVIDQASENEPKIFVDVCGAVLNPGVYELEAGSRIFQAVEAAGGYLPEAAADYLNRARSLSDGQQIYIPTNEEVEELAQDKSDVSGNLYEKVPEALRQELAETPESENTKAAVSSEDGSAGNSDARIDLNTADAALLSTLTGIGQSKAEAIIAYREEHGGFASIEEIMNVEGIKEGTFSKIKDKISAG